MTEQPEATPNPQLLRQELEEAANRINAVFREGGNATQVLDDIRRFPRPILVDFNNVIANNISPLKLNPDAPAFLEGLNDIGNVFIVTTAGNWEAVHAFFQNNNLWRPGMVLMTAPAYNFLVQDPFGYSAEAEQISEDFLGLKWGDKYTKNDLRKPRGFKVVAPIFAKSFEIPLIDDSLSATENNPGVRGITAPMWEPDEKDAFLREEYARLNTERPTLAQIVEMVRTHYAAIP